MICPECNGAGRVRKRFLLFFTRRARCAKCLGTGEFPPAVREVVRYRTRDRDDDDRDRWAAPSYGSTTSDSRPRDDDRFEVGSGGRSGGGGGGASWGGSGGAEPPVIADPFSSGGSAIAADAVSSDSSSSTSDSSSSSSSSDSGTSY